MPRDFPPLTPHANTSGSRDLSQVPWLPPIGATILPKPSPTADLVSQAAGGGNVSLAQRLRQLNPAKLTSEDLDGCLILLGAEAAEAMDRRIAFACIEALRAARPSNAGGATAVKDAITAALERVKQLGEK